MVLAYFKEAFSRGTKKTVYKTKLMLVGDENVGKTSLGTKNLSGFRIIYSVKTLTKAAKPKKALQMSTSSSSSSTTVATLATDGVEVSKVDVSIRKLKSKLV